MFERAVRLTASERSAWLRAVTPRDPALAQAVASMLATDAQLTMDRAPSIGDALARACDPALAVGTQLGGYTIEACVGVGGVGRVYRASDAARRVAIKCPRFPRHAGYGAGCLRREGAILAHLDHPGVVQLHAVGTAPSGQPYLVLEYIEGASITAFAAAHRLSLRARLQLVVELMSAVAYVHARGVVHCDLKASNVLVDRSGASRLIDLGTAVVDRPGGARGAAADDDRGEPRMLSLGSAAPEQWLGGAVTRSCDVYALGVLIYQLVCGRPPLQVAGLPYREAERAVLRRCPAPPSRRLASLAVAPDGSSTAAWGLGLRGGLDDVILRALHKAPERRHPSVTELRDQLTCHLSNLPPAADRAKRATTTR
jgi:eukaryotic-like serine/threonine-protein kinase